ncbi:hypothetical protein E2C01_000454 [Portunus trituberculatus]|uniref:Uncharacterized protein n=1 Tax=Portunus trituberculatus TaxID=210409 RepID=A0A5B7CHH3_PORTR|nr:hypothetical protein [Portunus trituberculatus]
MLRSSQGSRLKIYRFTRSFSLPRHSRSPAQLACVREVLRVFSSASRALPCVDEEAVATTVKGGGVLTVVSGVCDTPVICLAGRR